MLTRGKANPKLAERKDDDERLPIHWAVSYGHLDIAILLSAGKNFDPDIQVSISYISYCRRTRLKLRRMALAGHH